MFESKYSKVLTIVLIVVISAMVILLGFLAADYIIKYDKNKSASNFVETFQGDITTGDGVAVENNDENQNIQLDPIDELKIGEVSENGTVTKKKYKGYTAVGTIRIPKINIEYPILEEVTTKSLETGIVLLYPSVENLNEEGNTVLVGHNYRNGVFFSNLKKLSNGDKIYVTNYRGKSLTYEIYNKFEAADTDTSFYRRDTNGKAEITLSTCTDASNSQRTIIFAKEI